MSDEIKKQYVENQPVLFGLVAKLEEEFGNMILHSLDQSVANIMTTSTDIISEEDQSALQTFVRLYQPGNMEIQDMTDSVNDEVDSLLQDLKVQLKEKGEDQVDVKEDEDRKVKRLALAGYQKHLEMVHSADAALKDSLSNMIMDLQCHDLIHQLVDNLHKTFCVLIEMLSTHLDEARSSKGIEYTPYLDRMFKIFTTKRERSIFFRHFKRLSDKKIVEPKGRTLVMNLKIPLDEFVDQYLHLYKKLLLIANKHAEQTVKYIGDRLNMVLEEAKRLSNFSDDSIESMETAITVLKQSRKMGFINSKELIQMAHELETVVERDQVISTKIFPIITSLQFQDRIYQHTSSLAKILFSFQQTLFYHKEDEISTIFDNKTNSFSGFGQQILQHSNMKMERDLIRQIFKI